MKSKFNLKSSICVLGLSLIVLTGIYGFSGASEVPMYQRYDTCICTRYNSDGTTVNVSSCSLPVDNGPCDVFQDCQW